MYFLMHKNDVRAIFDLESQVDIELRGLQVFGTLPIGCTEENFLEWLDTRHATKHRRHLMAYLQKFGCCDLIGFLELTHGISINDCYWVKQDYEQITWEQVSPYANDFDEVIQSIAFDCVGLSEEMSETSPEFGTNGEFEKCWVREQDGIYLYKRGRITEGSVGREPFCEVLASQVFYKMKAGIKYELVTLHDKVASKCKLFNTEEVSFVPYGLIRPHQHRFKDMMEFYQPYNNADIFRRLLICDAITLNTDRHTGNHGALYKCGTTRMVSIAPAFDYNLALFPCVMGNMLNDIEGITTSTYPKIGRTFIDTARACLTDEIREDLLKLRGIELTVPFTTNRFPDVRVKHMTDIVNYQIDKILDTSIKSYPRR